MAASGNGSGSQNEAIVFQDVHIAFDEKRVLDGISFRVLTGETKVLLGVAGSGKSTILKLALGLLKPDRGRISVLGEDVTGMPEEALFALRRRVGMVFQESALFDSLTVEENVGYRLLEEHMPEEEARERVLETLRFVELDQAIDKYPAELSGGMRRRVAIARASITQPEVLLYDSPTGGLDPITATTIVELIVKQRDVYHTSSLMVTHRIQDAFTLATNRFSREDNHMVPQPANRNDVLTTFLILREGQVIFDGNARELASSKDDYIKEFIS